MKKIFISQPFKGRTEEEVFEERGRLQKMVEEVYGEPVEVIDQYHQTASKGAGRFYYLSQDLLMMGEADLIVFSRNWHTAKGCMVEHELARVYGLNYVEESKDFSFLY